MKTLFLGALEAQYKLCRQELEQQLLPSVDLTISLGNLISCSKAAKDRKDLGRNESSLLFWEKLAGDKTRLMGANEIMALNFPEEWTNNASNTLIRDAWLSAEPSALVATVDKGRLVTPAGLTYGEWLAIGSPGDPEEAAGRLNEKYRHTLMQGACFRLDRRPAISANPIWADPLLELYPSWVLAPEACPFDQVHGSESLNRLRGRSATSYESSVLAYMDKVSYRKFGSLAVVKEAVFRAIDLDLSTRLLQYLPNDKAFYVEKS